MSASSGTPESTSVGWAGWAYFAAAILFVNGMFSTTQGLVLLIGPENYHSANVNGELVLFNLVGWGWWNLILGVLLMIAASALFAGATWARVVAVIFAVISATLQLLLIPVQPFWSLIVIAIDVIVIFAIVVHGDELRKA